MPAVLTFEEFYDPEGDLMTALGTLFTAASLVDIAQQGTDTVANPRVTYNVTLGAALDSTHRETTTNSPATLERETAWRFTLETEVSTNRLDDATESTANKHTSYKKKVRDILAQWRAVFTDSVLPRHALADLDFSGSTSAHDDETREDYTRDTWAGVICFRASALPA